MAEPVAVEVLRDKPVSGRAGDNVAGHDSASGDSLFTAPQVRIVYQPAPFDPAALTNPELRALVQAISDQRLAHLLVEASRELKRRVAPDNDGSIDNFDNDANDCASGYFEPNPLLLRAARQAAGELSGEDE